MFKTNAQQIPTPANRAEWLKLRQIGIGGSDVAALLGISKWRTPLDVYRSKVEEPEEVDNASMEWGRRLEPVIRQKYADTVGMMVQVPEVMFRHPLHPYTQALLSAIPIPDPDIKMDREILRGELSSPINMGEGCRFAKRCPYARPECEKPLKETEVSPGHYVSCHLVDK